MILKKIGIVLPKNTQAKSWWIKLGISIILSNIFFFLIFSPEQKDQDRPISPQNWVDIQLDAEILTPLINGKKILLLNKKERKKIEGFLKTNEIDNTGKITVSVREEQAHEIITFQSWQILPFLRHHKFASSNEKRKRKPDHEIYY
jgi:hypothetical protein